MELIGILGGVCSGKSLVARQLAEQGAWIFDADQAGHRALRLAHVEVAASARWGKEIFGPDDRIDRRLLAKIVFSPHCDAARERTYLEELTHPEITRQLHEEIAKAETSGVVVGVLDAPLLFEAGWDRLCKRLIYVDAPRSMRLARANVRGWSKEDFTDRQSAQESLDQKRSRADVIIDNSGSPEQTRAQVEQFWHSHFG